MVTIYGIKNCDTMKKAFKWLDENGISYQFHNYKVDGVNDELIQSFIELADWKILVNTRGTSWRKLDDATKQQIIDAQSAKKIMIDNPSIIKRPVIIKDKQILVGFSAEQYQQFFN